MGCLEVEWLLPPDKSDSVAALWPPPHAWGWAISRRSDSYEEIRQGCTKYQQKPQEFESQPDPVLNTVIVLKMW